MTSAPVLHQPAPARLPDPDPEAYALEESLRSLIALGAATHPRSRQHAIGASEIGRGCARRLAYRLADVPPVNLTDPLRALAGAGVHAVMADTFRRLDAGSGRFLVEVPVRYRGVPGTCDLFDRLTGTVIDWKTILKSKVGRLRVNGPSPEHVTQVQVYGAALACQGENVRAVALAFLPVDATLADMWLWRGTPDIDIADKAVDRLNGIAARQLDSPDGRVEPSLVEPTPSALCRWCDHHNPQSTDSDTACRGEHQ